MNLENNIEIHNRLNLMMIFMKILHQIFFQSLLHRKLLIQDNKIMGLEYKIKKDLIKRVIQGR